MCIPNIISAEQENIFNFNTVSNGTTQNVNASISNAKLYGETALTSGISGNCIYFDGTNSYVELPQENRVQGLNSVSIAFWMKPKIDNSSGVTPVLHCGNVFEIGINNETRKINASLQTSSTIELTSSFNLERDMWHHIAVTYGDGRLCLYVNGKLDSHATGTGNIKSSNEPMYLGTNGTSYYKGNIDEIAFYKETLSEKDIGEIYHEYMDAITDWNYVSYPVKSSYQHGVSSASSELFKNSKIDKPINTGFEERNEINAINAENKNGQLEIVEDKYTGKFALKIKKTTEEIIPLQETEYFKTVEDDLLRTTSLQREDSGIDVSVNENVMTISGNKYPNEMVALLVETENEISYLSQTTANDSGYFEFKFPVDKYGDYTVRVGGSQSGSHATSFYFSDPNSKTPDIIKTEEVKVKCNSYSLMIKPMFKSETISFYVKTFIQDESGNTNEQYVLIKSDNDGDGIFRIGEDLSRGKWQKIELNLLDTDILFQSEAVAGLYIDANVGSEWIFDDIDSEYRKINQNDVPLIQFSNEKVLLEENTLQFAVNENGTAFNNSESVVVGGINTSQKISEITVKSENIYLEENNTSQNQDENPNKLVYTSIDGLGSVYDISSDGGKVFFANASDGNSLYSYDFSTKEYKKISDIALSLIFVSPDETMAALKKTDGTYCTLNLETQEEKPIPCGNDVHSFYFSPQNELFVLQKEIVTSYVGNVYERYFLYVVHNTLVQMIKDEDYKGSGTITPIRFDSTGNYAFIDVLRRYYRKTNGIWNEIKQLEYGGILSSDGKTLFGTNIVDITTGTVESLPEGFSFVGKTNDDLMLLRKNADAKGKCNYYLYNYITGENNKIFEYEVNGFTNPKFYSEQNVFMVVMPDGTVIRRYFTTEKPEVKYALSFDGKDNWYTYADGRWKLLSKRNTPTIKEMQSSGMTSEEINNIPTATYDKFYEDGNDVLTVDFAIYMNSQYSNQSPAIKQITVSTRDEAELSGLYGVHIEKYEKSEYRTVSSIFPIENFASNAECYYLLYIGNDWLYTYKDNKLVKTVESADELLSNIDTSWITFKQYGMTAKELRSIPENVINNLFVNDNYANTEFGVIYVVKTDSDDTNGFTVNFRLKSESSFIAEDDVVIEIIMGSGEKIVVDSNEFSKTDIENLLSWIEAHQNGSGNIFYRIKNSKKQYFINYYMINSVNVYNGTEYRESHSQIE